MTQLFIASSEQDAREAEVVRQELDSAGYRIWANTTGLGPEAQSYRRIVETGVLGSAAVVVLWGRHAARDEWVERAIMQAQRLRKPIFLLRLDDADLPNTLIGGRMYSADPSLPDAVRQLLPDLPPPGAGDELLALATQLADPLIRERRAGLERAARLLEIGAPREDVLAMLEHVARTDLITNLQSQAQAVLAAETGEGAARAARSDESRHIFGARCRNGHVTYFDKRAVCGASSTFKRGATRSGGVELDLLALTCKDCGVEIQVRVDCEGYK